MPDDSSIEELRKKLYARAGGPKPKARRKLREETFTVANQWQPEEEPVIQKEANGPAPGTIFAVEKQKTSRMMRLIFIGSGLFFVASTGLAAWLFLSNHSVISNNNIDINISGPVSVPGGEEANIQVEIVNRNPVPLILSDLIVEYPSGTKSPSNIGVDMPRTRETIGTIPPGGSVKRTIRAILFGVEGTDQKLKISYEYQIEDSNGLFTKDRDYSVLLSSAPVTVRVDTLKEISPGQELVLTAHVISNSSKILSNMLLTANYPFGFTPSSIDPKPTSGANVWELGDLVPGTERVVTIKGTLSGQNTEERVFRFEAGSKDETNPQTIAAVFQSTEVPVLIKSPFINLTLDMHTPTSQNVNVSTRGARISGDLHYTNTLPSQIEDLEVDLVFSGSTLDKQAIGGGRGFYRSIDNTIIWSSENNSDLAIIEPGESGNLSFTVGTIPFALGSNVTNPFINMVAHVKGRRLSEKGVPETLESTVAAVVKLNAEPQLATRVVYTSGPFQNTGPLPPRAETETTYTVIWTVANDINDVRGVTVIGRLPSYVKWLGVVSPQNADLTYDPVKGQVMWNVGALPAGTGYTTQPLEVAFQIAITPSISQVGTFPTLVEDQTLSGLDQFTGVMLETTHHLLNTELLTDINAPQNSGKVTP